MNVFCLKFSSKELAHSILYSIGEEIEIADGSGYGLPVERVFNTELNDYTLQYPSDGCYYADVRCSELPEELVEFIITTSQEYRKHKFAGEE